MQFGFLRRPRISGTALRGYRLERVAEFSFPIATGLLQGGFVGVIADKIFLVHPATLALITAAPMFGNLSSFAWARLAQGRRKVPLVVLLQVFFVLLTGAIALIPGGASGAWMLVCALVAAHLILGGIVTVRSLVWTLNYPRDTRSRVTARLALITTLTIALTVLLGSWLLDRNPEAFRWIFAAGAGLGAIGVFAFARVPVVGEAEQLELERGARNVETAGDTFTKRRSDTVLGVLRNDPLYARYLTWQFVLGVSNMMVEPALVYLVSNQLQASYLTSVAITVAIPMGLAVLTVPLWAPYLDRVHIAEFRARHSWFFAASQALIFLGALHGSLLILVLARVVIGLARGGGMLAWQLGHNDFADSERVGLYMGIHVSLTGLRGLIAPFAGMLLYVGWNGVELPIVGVVPAFAGLGAYLMLISCALSMIASIGFYFLHQRISRGP
ncbi:MAG: MFS transporter [bacterium]|nr:MFS transporter [bacterium]